MDLKELLRERKPAIVKKWFEAALASYHTDARGPMRRVEAQFTNPLGFDLDQGLSGLFDAVLQGMLPDKVTTFLDAIVRIRAVQDLAPSEALSFLFRLKGIIRDELGPELLAGPGVREELTALDGVVDDLALYAFDLYMRCREKIYDLKAKEAQNATFRLLQKAQLLTKDQE
jgi:hypothetical protein